MTGVEGAEGRSGPLSVFTCIDITALHAPQTVTDMHTQLCQGHLDVHTINLILTDQFISVHVTAASGLI